MRCELVLSCEHGGNRVPAAYRELMRGAGAALASHRGWDPGALQLARQLARSADAPLIAATTSRLVVDVNRSRGNPGVLSEWTSRLPPAEREALLERWWRPHREAVERAVRERARRGRVLHLSVHSFTPVWQGRPRRVDAALLYDPARPLERRFANAFLAALARRRPDLRLRRNHPYRGTADGLTTHLRRVFPAHRYLGLELEVSQRFPLGPPRPWERLRTDIATALDAARTSTGS